MPMIVALNRDRRTCSMESDGERYAESDNKGGSRKERTAQARVLDWRSQHHRTLRYKNTQQSGLGWDARVLSRAVRILLQTVR